MNQNTGNKNQQSQDKPDNSKAQKRIEELRNIYSTKQDNRKAKILLYGEWGTYKTTIAATAPRPILYHGFDPGGEKVKHIQDGVDDGSIIVDAEWQSRVMNESDTKFSKWNKEYNGLKKDGVFDEIGTYVVDSLTTLQKLVVDASVESNKRNKQISKKMPFKVPQMRDYGVQDSAMEFVLSDILDRPCHVIVIAHAEVNEQANSKGEITKIEHRPLITGKKLRGKLPMLFDEIWVTYLRGSTGKVLTHPKGMYHARTRLGSLFNMPKEFDNGEPGEFNLTRDILVPAGYATRDEIVEI